MTSSLNTIGELPAWVPAEVRRYLTHTESGRSLRAIARDEGLHASTVMRQIRRYENRRDDPLIDGALGRLKSVCPGRKKPRSSPKAAAAGFMPDVADEALDDARLLAEARRILRRLCEPGALMAVAADMERAVVLRDGPSGAVRLAVLDRPVAEAFALRDWIACVRPGRVARYEITTAGRQLVRQLLDGATPEILPASMARPMDRGADEACTRPRPGIGESPVNTLARRRDRDGNPFLSPALVAAAERLREDFEIAQIGPRATRNWEHFLSAPGPAPRLASCAVPARHAGDARRTARERVSAALRDLGPGLGDMALRCCCYLEGLESAERRLGWSARSGKIVLRIALMRLHRHYTDLGDAAKMMG
ncbi:MAG: DUF6456 domain-containing protein [Pararhodobacter sp.]